MDLQKSIIEKFNKTFNDPPLRLIAKETGIQISRIFRIINGHPMKLDEYLKFKESVDAKLGIKKGITDLARECDQLLSVNALSEIRRLMKRKLQLKHLLEDNKLDNQMIA